jgi:hypothetical protein
VLAEATQKVFDIPVLDNKRIPEVLSVRLNMLGEKFECGGSERSEQPNGSFVADNEIDTSDRLYFLPRFIYRVHRSSFDFPS